ncbi:MAG: hypothetical protein LWY06_16260, partial [Firmicutes bacterium]|nr:hypothetical protein [Bacillota bacterium]
MKGKHKIAIMVIIAIAIISVSLYLVSNTPEKKQKKKAASKAFIERGEQLVKNGNQTEALRYFNAAILEDPENWKAYLDRGGIYANRQLTD